MRRIGYLALAALLFLTACGGQRQDALTVFAAASLEEVLTEIGDVYMAAGGAEAVVFNFDSSGTLQTQIEEGAVCDVFLSAGQAQMDALSHQGLLLKDSRMDLLENKVVLAVAEGNPAGLESFGDLKAALEQGTALLAMGNSGVPVGQYTQKILEYLGLDEAALVDSGQLSYGASVKEVAAQIAGGAVDCGFVYATDAAAAGLTVADTATEEMCGRIIYPAAVLESSVRRDQAMDFLRLLVSQAGREMLEAYGFTPCGVMPLT